VLSIQDAHCLSANSVGILRRHLYTSNTPTWWNHRFAYTTFRIELTKKCFSCNHTGNKYLRNIHIFSTYSALTLFSIIVKRYVYDIKFYYVELLLFYKQGKCFIFFSVISYLHTVLYICHMAYCTAFCPIRSQKKTYMRSLVGVHCAMECIDR
jgi:hypothetical protein